MLALFAVSGAGLASVDNPASPQRCAGLGRGLQCRIPRISPFKPQEFRRNTSRAVAALSNKQLDLAEKLFRQAILKQPKIAPCR